jgi:hypothetical protein
MATFMEAMQAAREGKRVRPHPAYVINGRWHHWDDGRLWIEAARTQPADVCAMYLDCEWEIEQPPPKKYTFLEAVALMEQGKTMRPMQTPWIKVKVVNCKTPHHSVQFIVSGKDDNYAGYSLEYGSVKSEWEEVQ